MTINRQACNAVLWPATLQGCWTHSCKTIRRCLSLDDGSSACHLSGKKVGELAASFSLFPSSAFTSNRAVQVQDDWLTSCSQEMPCNARRLTPGIYMAPCQSLPLEGQQ